MNITGANSSISPQDIQALRQKLQAEQLRRSFQAQIAPPTEPAEKASAAKLSGKGQQLDVRA